MWEENNNEIVEDGREGSNDSSTENVEKNIENNSVTETAQQNTENATQQSATETTGQSTTGQNAAQKNSNNYNQNSYYNQNNNANNTYYSNANNNSFNNINNKKSPNEPKGPSKMLIGVAIGLAIVFIIISVVTSISGLRNNTTDVDKILNNSEKTKIGVAEKSEEKSDNTSSNGSVVVSDVSQVVKNAMPSVVAITSKTLVESNDYMDDIYDYYFGNSSGSNGNDKQKSEQLAAGSGFIIDQTDSELLIVTNNHVVEGADSLSIQFYGDKSKNGIDGYIKGTDASKDVAVVAVKIKDINKSILSQIKKVNLGDSDNVQVGEGVIAIGNALGYGQSVTTGIISAKDREVALENKTMKLLQTDAAINGGNSGGALLNSKGEVIGINVAKYSSNASSQASIEGMGFAIPITSVKAVIGNLETKKTREKVSESEKGYLGIAGNTVSQQDSQMRNMPQGVYVVNVYKDGPAQKAGITPMSIITKIDGDDVSSMETMQSKLDYYKAGEKVKITIAYVDGGEYKTKDVTLKLAKKDSLKETEKINNYFED